MKRYVVEVDLITENGDPVLPKIVSELISCKHCIHFDGYYCHNPKWGDGHGSYPPPIKAEDGFCDWSEREESEA